MVIILCILLIHLIGDFLFQGDKMKWLKFFRFPSLFEHITIYGLVLAILSPIILQIDLVQSILFVLINSVLHFVVDHVTGLLRRRYWEQDEFKYGMIMGVDQILHILSLLISFYFLIPRGFNYPPLIIDRLTF